MNAIQSDQEGEEEKEIPVLKVERLECQLPGRTGPFEHHGKLACRKEIGKLAAQDRGNTRCQRINETIGS